MHLKESRFGKEAMINVLEQYVKDISKIEERVASEKAEKSQKQLFKDGLKK